jgi:CheY-like chemotaxis protein
MPAAGFLGWNYRSQASLKTDPETKSIPVIAITASAMTYKCVTMLAEGFDGFQSKSISVKDFLEEVHRVLDSDHLKAV